MKKSRQKIDKIVGKIIELCENHENEYKESKEKLIWLFEQLRSCRIDNELDLINLIELHRKLCKIRNRKASYIENEIARLILVSLPFFIRMSDEEIPEDTVEILEEDCEADARIAIRLSSKLLKYGKEIILSKEDKSKRYKNRVQEAIRLLNELQQFYEVRGIKEIFQSKMHDKDKDLQFFALYGLEIYYAYKSADKLRKKEEEELEKIISTTKIREIASTSCQILINSGNNLAFLGALWFIIIPAISRFNIFWLFFSKK